MLLTLFFSSLSRSFSHFIFLRSSVFFFYSHSHSFLFSQSESDVTHSVFSSLALDFEQKRPKIKNILKKMKREGKIKLIGKTEWLLNEL